MKKKFFILFVTAILVFGVSAIFAGVNNAYGSGLEFKTEVHTNKQVKISYPELAGMGDKDKMAKINKLIKDDALAIKSPFAEELKDLEMDANFTVEYNGSNILSVKYLAYAYVKHAAHPANVIHTANVDLDKLKIIKLSDAVKIDESLVEKFLKGGYTKWDKDLNLASEDALKDIIANFDKKELLNGFKKDGAPFYFTKDSVVLSAEVIHAVGDHVEFAISYNDIEKALLFKPAGFSEVKIENTGEVKTEKQDGKKTGDAKKEDNKKEEAFNAKNASTPALELIEAICFSQMLHMDNFKSEPDETTITYTIFRLVSGGCFRWKDKLKIENDAYYFSEGPESEGTKDAKATYVSPDELYRDYFVKGKFKYAQQDISFLIEGTQTGIAVHLSDPPYWPLVEVKDAVEKDEKLAVTVKLSRSTNGDEDPVLIGDAVITLEKAKKPCYFKYRIVSFEAKYKKIDEIRLK